MIFNFFKKQPEDSKAEEPEIPTMELISPWIDYNGQKVITRDGLELVKHFEGLYLKSYLDPVGVPTIAYGRTVYPDGRKVQLNETCTEEQANDWLIIDLDKEGAKFVRAWIKRELKPYEWSALVSFTYNRGAGRFRENLVRLVNENKMSEAALCLKSYNWAGSSKKILPGLTRRRNAEAAMLLGDDWQQFLK